MMLQEEPELAYLKDKKGVSALFRAVANGHINIVEALLHVTRQTDTRLWLAFCSNMEQTQT
jgi:hypothetical protein